MNDADRRAAEQDCARLVVGYCHAADHDDAASFVALFTADAQWSRPNGSTVTGHDAMREYFATRPAHVVSRHICTNVLIQVTGDDSAVGHSLATVYRGSRTDSAEGRPAVLTSPVAIVENHDDFRRTEFGWRIQRRRSQLVFAN